MKKTELGNTGEKVSCMALGTMYFGSKTDRETSINLLDLYSDHGGSFLDTANKYASWVPGFKGGESEQLIGEWIRRKRNGNELFIATKVGFSYGEIPRSLKREIIISECEKSLKRLGVETIDLYFAHAFDINTPPEESMEAFYLLKKSGKIRFSGASNFTSLQLSEANEIAAKSGWEGFSCLQQRHTYLEPDFGANTGTQVDLTRDQMDFCAGNGMSIMAYSPLAGGFYGRNDYELPELYKLESNKARLKNLFEVAAEHRISGNALVLAWMMQNTSFEIPIVACSSASQLLENLDALTVNLSKEQLGKLNITEFD